MAEARDSAGSRRMQVREAHALADCVTPDECRWTTHRVAAQVARLEQELDLCRKRARDVASGIAPNRVRPSQVIILGARMTEDVLDLVRDVEDGLAEAVRAEAVAEERQRIIELAGDMCTYRERDGRALAHPHPADHLGPCPYGEVVQHILAAGSVPVASTEHDNDEAIRAASERLIRGGWYPSEYEAKPKLIEDWADRCARAVLQTAGPILAARVRAEAVAGERQRIESELRRRVAASTVQALLDQERRNAAAILESVVAEWRQACAGWQKASLARRAQVERLTAEVARYRAAIEGVHTLLLLAQSEGIDPWGCSRVKVKELADILVAALGDGE